VTSRSEHTNSSSGLVLRFVLDNPPAGVIIGRKKGRLLICAVYQIVAVRLSVYTTSNPIQCHAQLPPTTRPRFGIQQY
jgi:hypothetical protein